MSAAVPISTAVPPILVARIAPATAVAAPDAPSISPARTSARPFRRYESAPVIALGMMTGSGVPTAISAGAPRRSLIAGVVAMPPPMPKAPDSTPETNPIAAASAHWPMGTYSAGGTTGKRPVMAVRSTRLSPVNRLESATSSQRRSIMTGQRRWNSK